MPSSCVHAQVKKKLDIFVKEKKIPHIIFHGHTGSGKRYLLNYLIDKLYDDPAKVKQYVMYINCAHGKGIRFIRDELKFFARTNIHNHGGRFFKSIVLFNADNLTTDAQSALRRCIEQFSHTTRFFIVIEKRSKLLRPILSRFCNIYVPLPVVGGKHQSLHDFRKRRVVAAARSLEARRQNWLKKQIAEKGNYADCGKAVSLATKIYRRGYSALDVLRLLRTDTTINELRRYTLLVFFDRIRREFRNEKLLILLILNYTFMRPDLDLGNIEKM